jgi:hypothetical protein
VSEEVDEEAQVPRNAMPGRHQVLVPRKLEVSKDSPTLVKFVTKPTWCQFHQYFTSSFFIRKFFCAAFVCLQCGFVIFWQKDLGAKAAHKMLVTDTWLCGVYTGLKTAHICRCRWQ